MTLLNLCGIKKAFGEDVLFDDVSFEIAENDKIGLVGVNGAGKTSIFKIITEQMDYECGSITRHKLTNLGYMEQHACHDSEKTVFDEVLSIFSSLIELEIQLESINLDIELQNGDIEQLVKRQHELSEKYEQQGGLVYKSRVRAMLLGLGFSEQDFKMPVRLLSGGQRTKIVLGEMLLCEANLLLLDEPTNHLDIKAVEWLEDFLKNYNGAFVVISHDRYFLDRVTDRTFELENQKLTVYNGSYSYYTRQKADDQEYLARKYENTVKEITRIEGIIEQQKRWNREKNIKTAESKQKIIDKLEKDLEKPQSSPDNIKFTFSKKQRGGNDVLIATDLAKSFDHKQLFSEVDLHIKRCERVFLLGPNGCGKTTLFKIIMNQLKGDRGECKIGSNIQAGYYDQTQSDLDYSKTVLEEVYDAYPEMTQTELRNALAAFLFKSEDVFKEISALSGGERARVALLKLMLSQANFLLLDEPTNHLDIHSREALEQAFKDYDGTLFIISHDRYFINKMADKIVSLSTNGLQEYLGNYDYYVEKCKVDTTEKKAVPKENDYKAKKEQEAAKRKLLGRINRIEQEISDNEEKIKEYENELIKPEVASDYIKMLEISKNIDEVKQILDELYEKWESLQV